MKKLTSIVITIFLLITAVFAFGCSGGKFTVKFDLDGGTLIEGDSSVLEQVVSSADDIIIPKAEKEGYILSWSVAISKIDKDTTVKAIWIKGGWFNVTFNGNGGTLVSGEETQEVSSASKIIPPVYEKVGYTLSWDTDFTSANSDITVNAVWTAKTYELSFNNDGGTWDNGFTDDYKVNISYGEMLSDKALPTATKTDYKFEKWVIDAPNTELDGKTVNQQYNYDQDLTLKIKWVDVQWFTISYTGGGEFTGDNAITSFKETDSAFTLNEPTRTGYEFIGFTNSEILEPQKNITITPATVTSDLSFEANWQAKSYTVALNANGGACALNTISATYDQALTGLPVPTLEGFVFKGWQCGTYLFGVDGASTLWQIDDVQATLTAKWQKVSEILIQFNLNYYNAKKDIYYPCSVNGKDTVEPILLSVGAKLSDAIKNLSTPISKDNNEYSFRYWAYMKNGKLTKLTVDDTETLVDVALMQGGVITLYAYASTNWIGPF